MNDPAQTQEIQDLISSRQFDAAETAIRSCLKAKPASADGHYMLGVLHYFKGDLRQTASSLREALKHDPKHTDAAICLSVLLNDIGRYDDAKNVFQTANQSIARAKSDSSAELAGEVDRKFSAKHLELGDLYFRYRRYDEAIEQYMKAALLDPFTSEIRVRLAKAYAKKGFVTRAIQELQQLKAESPGDIVPRLQLGLLYYSQKNVLDAELEWESALALEPSNADALSYLEMAKRERAL